MENFIIATVGELAEYAKNADRSHRWALVGFDGTPRADGEGEFSLWWNRTKIYLSPEMGKMIDEIWTKKENGRVGKLSLFGMLKRLDARK